MVTKHELCKKIEEIFPHAGICGMDYDIEYDENTQSWEMVVNNGASRLRTFIKPEMVTKCLEGKSCDPLGAKISHIRPVTSPAPN